MDGQILVSQSVAVAFEASITLDELDPLALKRLIRKMFGA